MGKRWIVTKRRALLHVTHTKIIIIFGSPLKKEAVRLDLIVTLIQFSLRFFLINVLQWTNKHAACGEQTLFSVLIVSSTEQACESSEIESNQCTSHFDRKIIPEFLYPRFFFCFFSFIHGHWTWKLTAKKSVTWIMVIP